MQLLNALAAFTTLGYKICADGTLEKNTEKVAIFVDGQNVPKHAARQLQDGSWTSKLGRSNDISHSVESLENGAYGTATVYMSRKRRKTKRREP